VNWRFFDPAGLYMVDYLLLITDYLPQPAISKASQSSIINQSIIHLTIYQST
jgi:hypothetical protein